MSGIDDAALVELAALAEAADHDSEGERWFLGSRDANGDVGEVLVRVEGVPEAVCAHASSADAAFIAAANPQTVAALVAEVQRLRTVEAAVEALAKWCDDYVLGDSFRPRDIATSIRHAVRAAPLRKVAAARTGEASDG